MHPETALQTETTNRRFERIFKRRDAVLGRVGFPSGFEIEVFSLCNALSHHSAIVEELGKRDQAYAIMDRWRDKRRRHDLTDVAEGRTVLFSKVRASTVEAVPTDTLQKWKKRLHHDIEVAMNKLKILPSFEQYELSDQIKTKLQKYNKRNVFDLLNDSSQITQDDLEDLAIELYMATVFRNRKILEFAGYAFSRSMPLNANISEFLRHANAVVRNESDGKASLLRNKEIEGGAFPAFPVQLLPHAVNAFARVVERENNIEDAQGRLRESARLFLLFEIIHPFEDGNGRTGRALFSYLQRRFSADQYAIPMHIPISRIASGRMFQHSRVGTMERD